jgi:hypothetical protein
MPKRHAKNRFIKKKELLSYKIGRTVRVNENDSDKRGF